MSAARFYMFSPLLYHIPWDFTRCAEKGWRKGKKEGARRRGIWYDKREKHKSKEALPC